MRRREGEMEKGEADDGIRRNLGVFEDETQANLPEKGQFGAKLV